MWQDILKGKFTSLKQAYWMEKNKEVEFSRIQSRWHSWSWIKNYRRYKELRERGHPDADALLIMEEGEEW
tara:strand:- start:150 stop:359 length:210 start_codon:yes stop_codon:yes gene_type:complete